LLLAVLVIGYLGVGLVVADRLSAPSHQPQELTPTDVGLNYCEVNVPSTDGLELAGWWVPGNDPSRAVVLVPGIEGDKSDRHVLKTASVYAGAGHAVFMVDLRAQGGSEGERVTMGYKEVRDVRGALLWLNERGFASGEVVLHGFSLGGATVLRAAPKSGVAAVVEESAYADLPLILRQRLPKVSGLPSFFTPGVLLMGKLFLSIDPWAMRPKEDAEGSATREYRCSSSILPTTRRRPSHTPGGSRLRAPRPPSGVLRVTSTSEPTRTQSIGRGLSAFCGRKCSQRSPEGDLSRPVRG